MKWLEREERAIEMQATQYRALYTPEPTDHAASGCSSGRFSGRMKPAPEPDAPEGQDLSMPGTPDWHPRPGPLKPEKEMSLQLQTLLKTRIHRSISWHSDDKLIDLAWNAPSLLLPSPETTPQSSPQSSDGEPLNRSEQARGHVCLRCSASEP